MQQIDVMQGLVIGVGAGVTTSVIIGAWHWVGKVIARREQTSYIRKIITSYANDIFSATDLPPPPEPGMGPIPVEAVIFLHYNTFQKTLQVALSYRASALNYKRLASLQEKLASAEKTMSNLTLQKRKILPLKFAAGFYEEFQKLDWLKLPDRKAT